MNKIIIIIICFIFYICGNQDNQTTWKNVQDAGKNVINTAKDNLKDLKEKIEKNKKNC